VKNVWFLFEVVFVLEFVVLKIEKFVGF